MRFMSQARPLAPLLLVMLPEDAWGKRWSIPRRPLAQPGARTHGATANKFLSVGRRIIAALLMAEGLRDIAYSIQGTHMNVFWLPIPHESFVPGLLFLGHGIGIWRAWGLARISCGMLSLLSWIPLAVIGPLLPLFVTEAHYTARMITGWLVFSIPSGALAMWCFMPAIRRHFAEVREDRARARAVPG